MPDLRSLRPPAPADIDERAFRDSLGCFATGVTVVTTRSEQGGPLGVTVNSFASLSLDPPLVMFALRGESTTLPTIRQVGFFAVSVLATTQQQVAARFAAGPPRWDDLDLRTLITGAPVIGGSVASLDCRLHAIHPGGDHEILVGEVLALEQDPSEPAPLLYHRGNYASLR